MKRLFLTTAALVLLTGSALASETKCDCGYYLSYTEMEDDNVPFPTRQGRFLGHFTADGAGGPASLTGPVGAGEICVKKTGWWWS